MNLGPGMRTPEGRPWMQVTILLVLALGCAALSNSLAGPTRHLAWRPAPPPPPRPAPKPQPTPLAPGPAAPTPSPTPIPAPIPKAASRAPQPPPQGSASPRSLQDLYPAPADGAPFEIADGEALALHRAGAVFIDARRTSVFEEGHVAGAKVISPWEDGVEAKIQAFADATFDPKDPVVIYCSGGDCRDSHLLADRLWPLGFRNLRIFKGGWPAWKALGGPSARGAEGAK